MNVEQELERFLEEGGNVYEFHRENSWYPIQLKDDAEAIKNAECNPGTLKVVNAVTRKEVWSQLPLHQSKIIEDVMSDLLAEQGKIIERLKVELSNLGARVLEWFPKDRFKDTDLGTALERSEQLLKELK